MCTPFQAQDGQDKNSIELGVKFLPKFDRDGLIACITTDADSGDVVMFAYMNAQSLQLTLESGQAHYWSRSRQALWLKGETSGNVQDVIELRTDCDQDAIWLKVRTRGAAANCHQGYKSCFYRAASLDDGKAVLSFKEDKPLFDPSEVYK
ncbi:phosphoribosyl-AMP cyclohydrolase [Cohaesibacter celericrescens]|uniref:Phosphoribosyl-AMP cyclohydrolase n=1 Tax=Cohaesibacter celericrescens TaxID=2067669 RepID=A0A2N5XWC0_9HYPH|nr:phosphoribosyl-AMP cyclohydrolase [Cohaesibacter celericrescens]PLW78715.1 phosphoribosyl-AMP cyclohydrolase [Cohaesibacter celericrescens]